jgi:hypothetical protein
MVSIRPRGARSLVENGRTEDLRPLAESEHRGAGIQRPTACARQVAAHLSAGVRAVPGKHRTAAPGGAKLVHA